jgi:hypothetical protein
MRRWNGVREELRRGGGTASSGDLWQRIEASRSVGATLELPSETHRTLSRVGLYGMLAVASWLALLATRTNPLYTIPTAAVPDWSRPFLPEAALAQVAGTPHLPAIGPLDGSRLKPGRWVYAWTPTREQRGGAFPKMADTLTIRRGTFRDDTVWVVTQLVGRTSGQGSGRLDSLYLNLSNLRPLRHALLAHALDRFQRAGAMDLEKDTLRWRFRLPGGGIPGRDTVVTALLTEDYAAVWSGLPLVLNGIQFAKNWAGAVPMLLPSIDWSGRDSPVHIYWIDLRVTRRERVTVPAGTFDCWRISQMIPGNDARKSISELWVDSRSGVLVKEVQGGLSYSPHGRELTAILP